MHQVAAMVGVPYGASLAKSTCPGGTSAIRACRSLGDHQAVSKKRLGSSAAGRQIQARSQIPAWARISRMPGKASQASTA